MAEQERWEMEGIVLARSCDGRYRVRLENEQEVTAEVAGGAQKKRFSIYTGDRIPVIAPRDPAKDASVSCIAATARRRPTRRRAADVCRISISNHDPRSRLGRFCAACLRWLHRPFLSRARWALIGRCYRDLAVETHNSHWIVLAVYRVDGCAAQAVLRSLQDGSVRRTLALRVLEDPSRFQRLG